MKISLCLLIVILGSVLGGEIGIRRYNGYQVYSVTAKKPEQYKVLWEAYTKDEFGLDFWTKPVMNGKTDIMVPPEEQDKFEAILEDNQLDYEVKIDNVQSLIDEEQAVNEKARLFRSGTKAIDWTSYATYEEIEEFINSLPSNIATVEKIGESYEKRNLYAVKISTSPNNRKAIVIDANIHAREWITSATATYIMNALTSEPSDHSAILNGIDYYFIPMINVDGYEYSRTADRMWRKTRSVNPGSLCRGCDPNRNFPFQFGGEGTSSRPCSDTYKGTSALSESETTAVHTYITRLVNDQNIDVKAYISFHSYGQLWLLPWGYTANAYPEDYEDQETLGNAVRDAIANAVDGRRYTVGTGADVLYGVGGASDDWAKNLGIKYTVTAEMRDTGRYGFILPASEIIPNSIEMLAALRVVADRVRSE